MKKPISLLFLLFLLPFINFASQDQLPSKTWRLIEREHKLNLHFKWEYDVHVKLRGNYTPQDSAMVINALEELNQLTETIQIGMSPHDRGNLELFFIDSTNARDYEAIITIPFNRTAYSNINNRLRDGKKNSRTVDLGIRINEITDTIRQHYITSILSGTLYPSSSYYNDSIYINKELLKEVYSAEYE